MVGANATASGPSVFSMKWQPRFEERGEGGKTLPFREGCMDQQQQHPLGAG